MQMIQSYDYALFVKKENSPTYNRLCTYESVVIESNEGAVERALKALHKQSYGWMANYPPYYSASFAIYKSEHGQNNWKMHSKI